MTRVLGIRDRSYLCLFIATFVPLCWYAMLAVHELGHVLGAAISGGEVSRVVLHPLSISRTELAHNPRPLLVVWAGPLIGVVAPMLAFCVVRCLNWRWISVVQFFAGFCSIANGAYIAIGSSDRVGDCDLMLQHGSPIWLLWLFGVVTISVGFYLWHRLGSAVELMQKPADAFRSPAMCSSAALLVLIVVELAFSAR